MDLSKNLWRTGYCLKTFQSCLVLLCFTTCALAQERIHVDSLAMGANNGSSWLDAYTALQDALNDATAGDTILVSKGTYYPDEGMGLTDNDRNLSFNLLDSVVLLGGFCAASGDTTLATRDWVGNPTILSGEIQQDADSTNNSYHVVTSTGLDAAAVLDGFTVTLGNANGSGSNRNQGGGMFNNSGSSPTITNILFLENTALSGGGMYNRLSSSPTITGTTFLRNTARFGGGMFNSSNSSPGISNAIFSENTAENNGGGMLNSTNSSPIINKVIFSGNMAGSNGGGGMYNGGGSSPSISNAVFSGNTAHSGGAIYNIGATGNETLPRIINATFSGNTAEAGGAGGAIFNINNASPSIINSIIWNNCVDGVSNTVSASMFSNPDTDPQISYSLIANSGGSGGAGLAAMGTDLGNNIDQNPLFIDSLTCAAAPTTAGNLRLQDGSPAINAGNNDSIPVGITVDLDSMPRIQQDIVDMGAFEFLSCMNTSVLYVDAAASGTNTGLSWANAFNNLQDALTYACDLDTILVSKGTYFPDEGMGFTDNVRDSSFRMRDGVVILGGFCTATGDSTLATRDWKKNKTILSGDIDRDSTLANNSYHVVTSIGLDSTAVLDGFIITEGNANGVRENSNGGGMYNNPNSSPSVNNTTFVGNSATSEGGGMYNYNNSNPKINNSSFKGNSAGFRGGGMLNDLGSSPSINNTVFSGNSATSEGGGMHNLFNSNPSINNSTFSGNLASVGGGGGMYNNGSNPSISNSIIWNNCANGDTTSTSASIFNISSNPIISYSLIANSGGSGAGWDTDIGMDDGNNIDTNALFVMDVTNVCSNPSGGDLHLQSASPAINIGNNVSIPLGIVTDLDGLSRIVDGTVDMGAYEWRQYCKRDTVYLDALGMAFIERDRLINEIPSGCDTLPDIDTFFYTCTDIGANAYSIFVTGIMGDTTFRCTDTVVVLDTIAPVIVTCAPRDTLYGCDTSVAGVALIGGLSARDVDDNCGAVDSIYYQDSVAFSTCMDTIWRSWIAVDSSGNTDTCVQMLLIDRPTVDAGMAMTMCRGDTVDLNALGASVISNDNSAAWSSSGDGSFDGGGVFGTATIYIPGDEDKANGNVTLTLSLDNLFDGDCGEDERCGSQQDAVEIRILYIDCGNFPWDGN